MRALIIGADMVNKGAELMLRALVHEMRARHHGIELAISPGMPGYRRAKNLELERLNVPLSNPGYRYRFPPGWYLRTLLPDRVLGWSWGSLDLLLDVSGFAYSDQWGLAPARNLRRMTRSMSRRGRRVVLFPQAFGPFKMAGHASVMKQALDGVDLVFARDATSLGYVTGLGADCEVARAPDLTLGFEVHEVPEEGWVAMVPNVRMVDQGADTWGGSRYLDVLARIGARVRDRGFEIRVVLHDVGGADGRLAEALIQRLEGEKTIRIHIEDPVELKRELATASFVVGSRFHALASSLACGVPVLALGWSHKYAELLSDFGVGRFAFRAPDESLMARVDDLTDPGIRLALREQLMRDREVALSGREEMWRSIEVLLDAHRP